MINAINKVGFIFILFMSLFANTLAFSQTDSLNVAVITNKPVIEGIITVDKDEKIDKLIETKIKVNRSNKDGYYRIQIYNGPLTGAEETKEEFKKQHYDWPCEMSFESPNYKVRVGKFRTRLEAEKQLLEVRKKYSNAFLLVP